MGIASNLLSLFGLRYSLPATECARFRNVLMYKFYSESIVKDVSKANILHYNASAFSWSDLFMAGERRALALAIHIQLN